MTRSSLSILALLLALGVAQAEAVDPTPVDTMRFFGGHAFDARLVYFFNPQDDLQRERFVTEGALRLEFDLISWPGDLHLTFAADMKTGMGDSITDNLPFSPKEMDYKLSPVVEQRSPRLLTRVGWDHACQHLIYKDDADPWYLDTGADLPPDVYHNRIFAGFGSPETRPAAFRRAFLTDAAHARPLPLALGYAEAGYYLRSLGGLIEEESLYGFNDWAFDLNGRLSVPVWRNDVFIVCLDSATTVLFDTGGTADLRETLAIETHIASTGYGVTLWLGAHVIDEHPRDSKEGLWELGLRFSY